MEAKEYLESLVARSRAAQKVIEGYSQEQIDKIVRMLGKVVFDNAEMLAQLAVEETGMGVYKYKVAKNMGKPRMIWNDLKTKKSVGVLETDPENGLTIVAKPMGVVGAVTPCTNPIVTPMCNAMFAVKCRNTIIIAPHPRAKKCAVKVAEMYHEELRKMGVPEDIFLVIEEPSIELTNMLMGAVDVVIATGGMGMVKAAYSSGKPSFGVGAGNVQCVIDRGMDISEVVPKIVDGRTFDNGIVCTSEQTCIVPEEQFDEVIAEFKKNGAYYIDDAESLQKIREGVFPGGVISRDVVGQGPAKILELAGIEAPEGIRMVLVKPEAYGKADLLSKEKMCPLMCVYTYKTWEEAVEIALTNLLLEGSGHTASLHSNDKAHIEEMGIKLPISRLVVNQVCATNGGGSFQNGLNPTTTLGCGSWGNNSISENLSYFHLMNRARIAEVKPDWAAKAKTDEEIWAE